MNKLFAVIASSVLCLSAQSALAAQYEVYVTAANQVSAKQAELAGLVQKGIMVDTTEKTLKLVLSPVCKSGAMCPMFVRYASLPLVKFQANGTQVVEFQARGKTTLNGMNTLTEVSIKLNANNATDIVISNQIDSKNETSSFVGSPATLSDESNL